MKTISAEELKKKLDANEEFELVNVLPKEYFDKKHIPKSKNLSVEDIDEKAAEALPDKAKEIVVYCANTQCQASPNAAKKLEALGYTNVADYEDGVTGWEEAGYDLEGSQA